MPSLRTTRALALLLVVAWLAAATSSQVHGLVIQHVVCPEHGKTEEIHRHIEDGADQDERDQLAAPAGSSVHSGDHGCLFLAGFLSSDPPPSTSPVASPRTVAPTSRAPVANGPRAPPLRYAPKTSPPLA
jgi:hypothetical protein